MEQVNCVDVGATDVKVGWCEDCGCCSSTNGVCDGNCHEDGHKRSYRTCACLCGCEAEVFGTVICEGCFEACEGERG